MKNLRVRIGVAILSLFLLLNSINFIGCSSSNLKEKAIEFYDVVSMSQSCLDEVADDIYEYWHDAIYNDYYNGNISLAVYYAQQANAANLAIIAENEPVINSLYKELKNSQYDELVKNIMTSYSEYYELVVNVSGSYNSYSASKENLKKSLASALKQLEFEL